MSTQCAESHQTQALEFSLNSFGSRKAVHSSLTDVVVALKNARITFKCIAGGHVIYEFLLFEKIYSFKILKLEAAVKSSLENLVHKLSMERKLW